jgi:subfamily B ATP-binding cassette protein MsbA
VPTEERLLASRELLASIDAESRFDQLVDATSAEIKEAAILANAHDFISKMPMGYDTIIGERGVTLSGGERQRIGIARTVVRNAPILILDEPTAALDAESEKIVNEALERLMKGKTVITISHRLNILKHSNNIFMIKDGMVVEEGTHDFLLMNSKYYSALYYINESPTITTVLR